MPHLRELDCAGGTKVMLARRIPEAKHGQHDRHDAPCQAPKPELLIMGGHEGCRQGQAVADQAGKKTLMRSAEALSGVGLSRTINRPPRNTYMAVREMSHARSRFCILKKNTKGTSAMNM